MIPLSVPNLSGNEWTYIKECLDTNWVSSVGTYVTRFEKECAAYCGVPFAIATSNGTTALHTSLLLAGVKENDLVLIPNITFVAPTNSIKYVGAEPILVDIDRNTWQIDLNLLQHFLETFATVVDGNCIHKESKRRIAAIVPVHVLGNICQMDQLLFIAQKFKLAIIEDATEALGSKFKNKHAGSFGSFGCLSFNGNKIITTGGGGMILTSDEKLARRAKHLTTQAKSEAHEYYHDEVGYNYRLVNILAAMGVAQLEQLTDFVARKKQIAKIYGESLNSLPGFQTQQVCPNVDSNHWLFTLMLKDSKKLISYLRENEIETRPLWVPMNQLPAFKDCIYIQENNVSNEVYSSSISLPCSTNITDEDLTRVIESIKGFYK